ncbi:MAG: adenylate/guanylate cyclase domain-containing protein [Pseudomonadota bacterium]
MITRLRNMLDSLSSTSSRRAPDANNPVALAALEEHKAEGMRLAVRARLIALAVICVLLPVLTPDWGTLYYVAFAGLFALNGWAQLRAAQVGQSSTEVLLLCLDLVLLTAVILIPNPFFTSDVPLEMQYRFNGHSYFYIYLALGTLAYSWRTVRGYATFGAVIWLTGVGIVWWLSDPHPSSAIAAKAFADNPVLAKVLDPGNIEIDRRVQEVVLFALVAFILSITVKRFYDLLFRYAASERQRTNLSRYFSPNMVEELAGQDDPLKQIKEQRVAVLFVDIVGFTTFARTHEPEEVIETLREFHALMEGCVFDNRGTLDKFLGDGLMATFGTPIETADDPQNSFRCAMAMTAEIARWNEGRVAAGKTPLRIGIGIHYGPCMLGDIGGESRMEFAVIGDTVNMASRVEAKTRDLGVDIAITEELYDRLQERSGETPSDLGVLRRFEDQKIRGIDGATTLYGTQAGTA